MSMLFDVWLIMHSTTSLIDEALVSTDLSGDDFGLYSLLRRFGPATPSQISRWTGMRPTTVSAALKRLDGRGHGTRLPHPTDGRSYLVGLNDDGIAAHGASAPAFLAAAARLQDDLGAGESEVRAALQRLDQAFRTVLQLDDRPYGLSHETTTATALLTYGGEPLTADQEREVQRYIAFLRSP